MLLAICATLFIAFNLYAAMHYDLRHFAACPRAFYSVNGWLMGIAITVTFLLWLARSGGCQAGADVADAKV